MSQIIRRALKILESRMTYGTDFFNNPTDTKNFLRLKLGSREREVFALLYLSNRNQLISYEELFFGTIDGSSVHIREIVKLGLALNAAAVICNKQRHPLIKKSIIMNLPQPVLLFSMVPAKSLLLFSWAVKKSAQL